jgi:hypothetical protein
MRTPLSLLALGLSLLSAPDAMALSEFGIEGMGVVSTKANEAQATIAPDGQRIVWASDRDGGAGGWDLWQAVLRDGRWQDPTPLAVNTASDEVDPFFSHDGAWLYFASNRPSGRGGFDLYVATAQGRGFNTATPLPAPLNSAADELGGDWLGNNGALAITRVADGQSRVWLVGCDYAKAAVPLVLSFNTDEGQTGAPVVDASKPSEMVVAGQARSPRAGGLDLYRLRTPGADCRRGAAD